MEFRVVADQFILTGPVANADFEKTQNILANSSNVDTVVLRNSPGGDVASRYRLGELFRKKGLRTLVSGFLLFILFADVSRRQADISA